MTTLNGVPRSWDSFIQGIYARKNLVKFSRLWEECSQEESRIAAREEKMGSEDQALTAHSKKERRKHHYSKGKYFHKYNTRKYLSRIRCYTCDEKGHYARECPRNKNVSHKRRETREYIMLMMQRMMNLPKRKPKKKVMTLLVKKNMF